MFKILLRCLVIVILFGMECCNPAPNIKTKLEENHFWDVFGKEWGTQLSGYEFQSNGTCNAYLYRRDTYDSIAKFHRSIVKNDGDVVVPHSWEVINDSLIIIQGMRRKVLSIKKDSIILINPISLDSMILVNPKINNFTGKERSLTMLPGIQIAI